MGKNKKTRKLKKKNNTSKGNKKKIYTRKQTGGGQSWKYAGKIKGKPKFKPVRTNVRLSNGSLSSTDGRTYDLYEILHKAPLEKDKKTYKRIYPNAVDIIPYGTETEKWLIREIKHVKNKDGTSSNKKAVDQIINYLIGRNKFNKENRVKADEERKNIQRSKKTQKIKSAKMKNRALGQFKSKNITRCIQKRFDDFVKNVKKSKNKIKSEREANNKRDELLSRFEKIITGHDCGNNKVITFQNYKDWKVAAAKKNPPVDPLNIFKQITYSKLKEYEKQQKSSNLTPKRPDTKQSTGRNISPRTKKISRNESKKKALETKNKQEQKEKDKKALQAVIAKCKKYNMEIDTIKKEMREEKNLKILEKKYFQAMNLVQSYGETNGDLQKCNKTEEKMKEMENSIKNTYIPMKEKIEKEQKQRESVKSKKEAALKNAKNKQKKEETIESKEEKQQRAADKKDGEEQGEAIGDLFDEEKAIDKKQKKCQEAYSNIPEINESSEENVLNNIKAQIMALKNGDCKEKNINQTTWKLIDDKIKAIDDIIKKKNIDTLSGSVGEIQQLLETAKKQLEENNKLFNKMNATMIEKKNVSEKDHEKLLTDLIAEPLIKPTEVCRTYVVGDKATHKDYNRMVGNVFVNYGNQGYNAIVLNNVGTDISFLKDTVFNYDTSLNKDGNYKWYDSRDNRNENLKVGNYTREISLVKDGNAKCYPDHEKYYQTLHNNYTKLLNKKYEKLNCFPINFSKIKYLEEITKNIDVKLLDNIEGVDNDKVTKNIIDFLIKKKTIEKCDAYLDIMLEKMNMVNDNSFDRYKEEIKKALKDGEYYDFKGQYSKTPWGSLGGNFQQSKTEQCTTGSIVSTVIDFAVRANNKNICIPHGIELTFGRPYIGEKGELHDTFGNFIKYQNNDLEKSIKNSGGDIKRRSGLPVHPSFKIDDNYKENAWVSSKNFINENNFNQTPDNLEKIKKGIQKFEKEKNINICPIEDLSSWYLDDFTKKIPAYKKGVDPKFNTPSKIRYAIERCLFNNEDIQKYNPDNICGIYIPLGVTTGIEKTDNANSNINHANLIYIEKVKKVGNKHILKMYGFDPNYEPTFYLKERLDELIEEFNKLNKDYEFETKAVILDLNIPRGLITEDDGSFYSASINKTGIHSFFPKDRNGKSWINGGICGSVTWFAFILWSLVCKHTNGNFYDMYMNLCAPLAVYNQLQNEQLGEKYKKTLGPEIVKKIEDLYLKFVHHIWGFLKWSETQLKNKDYYDIWSYKKKLCYLELILHKINKHQKGDEDLVSPTMICKNKFKKFVDKLEGLNPGIYTNISNYDDDAKRNVLESLEKLKKDFCSKLNDDDDTLKEINKKIIAIKNLLGIEIVEEKDDDVVNTEQKDNVSGNLPVVTSINNQSPTVEPNINTIARDPNSGVETTISTTLPVENKEEEKKEEKKEEEKKEEKKEEEKKEEEKNDVVVNTEPNIDTIVRDPNSGVASTISTTLPVENKEEEKKEEEKNDVVVNTEPNIDTIVRDPNSGVESTISTTLPVENKEEEKKEEVIISKSFSFTPILSKGTPTGFKPITGAAGHPGALATFDEGNKKWSAKVFFNNPNKATKYNYGEEKNMILLYDLYKFDTTNSKELEENIDKYLISKDGKKKYHITEYNEDSIKENTIGLLEKSIYELFNNHLKLDEIVKIRKDLNTDVNFEMKEFVNKWMYKIHNEEKPNKIFCGSNAMDPEKFKKMIKQDPMARQYDPNFSGKLYFTMENPFHTIEDGSDTRYYDIKIGKKTVFKEDKGSSAARTQGRTDKMLSISFDDGFRLEGVVDPTKKMEKLITILKKNKFNNIFRPVEYYAQIAQKLTNKFKKQQSYRIKPILMFTEMFSHFGENHDKRQKVIEIMDKQVKELALFTNAMSFSKETKFGFIGSSMSVVINDTNVKINIFDYGHPWIYHKNRLLEYPSRSIDTYQDRCKKYEHVKYSNLIKEVLSKEAFYNIFPITVSAKKKALNSNEFSTIKANSENLPCIFTVYVHIIQSLYRFEMTLQLLLNNKNATKPSSRDDVKKIIVDEGRFLINSLPFITCNKTFTAVDYINKKLNETTMEKTDMSSNEGLKTVEILLKNIENNNEITNINILKLIRFFQLYTNPIKNTRPITFAVTTDKSIKPVKYDVGEINLWTFDINEIILYHVNYNRDTFVSKFDDETKWRENSNNEIKIFNDIHKNYWEGLLEFCNSWKKWKVFDDKRIKRIQEITDKLGNN